MVQTGVVINSVDVPMEKVGHHGMYITVNREVLDWLSEVDGWGDDKWWQEEDALLHHLENCTGRTRCGVEVNPCRSEAWGWTIVDKTMLRFMFRNPDTAMLFKLTWGGA